MSWLLLTLVMSIHGLNMKNLNIVVLYNIYVARYASRSDLPKVNFKFFAKIHPLELDKGFIVMWPSKYKIQPQIFVVLLLLLLLQTPNSILSISLLSSRNSFTLLPVYLYWEDERALPLYPQSSNFFRSPHFPLSVVHLI